MRTKLTAARFTRPLLDSKTALRLQGAADTVIPMRRGEWGEAVKVLQQALIDLGDPRFGILSGPTGFFGHETFHAVFSFQDWYGLQKDGEAGGETLGELNKLFTSPGGSGSSTAPSIRPAVLNLFVQVTDLAAKDPRTSTNLTQYTRQALSLLAPFGLSLDPKFYISKFVPTSSPVDLSVQSDVEGVRKDAGGISSGPWLRVIHCPFESGSTAFGATFGRLEGYPYDDFCLLNSNKTSPDFCSLLHEMIHATGLRAHDTDLSSVFSLGAHRTVLRPEHAQRLSNNPPTFFSAPKAH